MIALTTVAALLLGFGGCVVFQRTKPLLIGTNCLARVGKQAIELDPDQAAVAATIAGVGHRAGVPSSAVTVAFASALQESHLHNVNYGDRDSVGVFQQRPSQGWGTPSQLMDPVYAATKFFAALVKVPGYWRMPVYRAAQAVQHSADATAYAQYSEPAAMLATAFTGRAARGVWCWYEPYPRGKQQPLSAAATELQRTFGPLETHASTAAATGTTQRRTIALVRARSAGLLVAVPAGQAQIGWALAGWAVTHATTYGIQEIRYAGFAWRASAAHGGWRPSAGAPANQVELG